MSIRQITKALVHQIVPDRFLLIRGDSRRGEAPRDIDSCRTISLTFDDGPHPEWTPAVLDVLDTAGWRATFFVVGHLAEERPALIREIIDRGHEIGNHTYSHREPQAESAIRLVEDTLQAQATLKGIMRHSTNLMRPPKGQLTIQKLTALWRLRQTVVLWNVDTKDFEMTDSAEPHAWAESYHPSTGDVVLLHDRLPFASEIVRRLAVRHGRSLRCVPVSYWLGPASEPRVEALHP